MECEFYDPLGVEDGGDDCRGTKNCYDQPDAERRNEEVFASPWQKWNGPDPSHTRSSGRAVSQTMETHRITVETTRSV